MENLLGLSVTSFTHAKSVLEKRHFAWGEFLSNADIFWLQCFRLRIILKKAPNQVICLTESSGVTLIYCTKINE